MQRTEPRLAVVAVVLAALAGFVDALAFTSLGGFFAAFMSGNATRLGVALGSGEIGVAAIALSLIFAFVSGVIFVSVIARAAPGASRAWGLAAVTLLLAAAAAVSGIEAGSLVALPLGAAMGAAHYLLHREGVAAGGLASLTVALVQAGERLAGALMGDRQRWAWLPPVLLFLGFVAGAALGAEALARFGGTAFWLAAALAGAGAAGSFAAARTGGRAAP